MHGHASLCTNGEIHLSAILLQQLSLELAAKAGWVEGYHTLSSVLFCFFVFFAHQHSDLCLSAHSSVKQDRECLLERVHSTWERRMPPAEEPAVAPVHKKAEEKNKRCKTLLEDKTIVRSHGLVTCKQLIGRCDKNLTSGCHFSIFHTGRQCFTSRGQLSAYKFTFTNRYHLQLECLN